MARDRFTFSENFKEIADALDDDKRLKFYDAITNYIFKDIEPTDPYIVALFNSMKYLLDRTQFWGGKRTGAGAPKGNANAKKNNQVNQDSIKIQSNDNQNQSSVKLDCFAYNKNNINKINNTQELDNNTGKSNKGVIGGKEKGDSFVAELERQELAKVKSKTDDDFDRFWAAYTPVRCSDGRVVPKGSKKETRAKFDKYIKAGVKADDIIVGAKKYLASCQANDRLSCGATVFLNQERWKDDWSAQGIQATRKAKSISSPDYVGEGSFLRRAEDDPFCADL